jgi:hypothetical protein
MVEFPVHTFPPFCGAGFVQVRFLVRVPLPQLRLQSDQGMSLVLQLPSTEKRKIRSEKHTLHSQMEQFSFSV